MPQCGMSIFSDTSAHHVENVAVPGIYAPGDDDYHYIRGCIARALQLHFSSKYSILYKRGAVMLGDYGSMIWVNDDSGKEYVCIAEGLDHQNERKIENLSDEERSSCVDVNQFIGTERW